MNNIMKYFVLCSLLLSSQVLAVQKMDLTIYQVMQRVLDRYPLLKVSDMEVLQAEQQKHQVESSLGWMSNSSAGVTHDLTALGTPSDRMDINSSISRKLRSGATVSLIGGYRYEDSSLSFNSALPNPAHTTRLDLNYRMPLSQGDGNPLYKEGLASADSGYDLALANQLLVRIQLAEKVKELFYASALTRAKIINAQQAVKRARKLEVYIRKNVKLGLSEEKDKLQAIAQLNSKLSELSAIRIQWKQQQYSLNRLMLEGAEKTIYPILFSSVDDDNYDVQNLIDMTKDYHPTIKISKAKLDVSESKINTARDDKKDSFDLVVSVGSRTSNGESKLGTVNEKDWAGAIGVEYKHLFDDNGVNSKYKQAQLERTIALQNIKITNNDIRYTIARLIAEIKAAKHAVVAANNKLKSESLKLKEAEYRFRNGRANTAQLIQFQNEYSFSQLSYQNQKIDLRNRIISLDIFSGQFWQKLNIKSTEENGVEK